MRNGYFCALRVVAALSGLALSSAWGAESGFYFGVTAGQSDFDVGSASRASPPVLVAFSSGGPVNTFFVPTTRSAAVLVVPETSSRVDERDATFSAAVGYTFNRYLSVELSYADLGEFSASSVTTFTSIDPTLAPTSFRVNQELSAETLAISVLGTYPVSERWSLFGRGGYGYSESDVDVRAAFMIPGTTASMNASGTVASSNFSQEFDSEDFVLGAGVGYRLSSRWSLRLDYERIFEAGAEAVDVDRIGLSAILRL